MHFHLGCPFLSHLGVLVFRDAQKEDGQDRYEALRGASDRVVLLSEDVSGMIEQGSGMTGRSMARMAWGD